LFLSSGVAYLPIRFQLAYYVRFVLENELVHWCWTFLNPTDHVRCRGLMITLHWTTKESEKKKGFFINFLFCFFSFFFKIGLISISRCVMLHRSSPKYTYVVGFPRYLLSSMKLVKRDEPRFENIFSFSEIFYTA